MVDCPSGHVSNKSNYSRHWDEQATEGEDTFAFVVNCTPKNETANAR